MFLWTDIQESFFLLLGGYLVYFVLPAMVVVGILLAVFSSISDLFFPRGGRND